MMPDGSAARVTTSQASKSTKIMLLGENQELKARARAWQIVGALAGRIARGDAFGVVMDEAIRECAGAYSVEMVAILILSADGGHLQVQASVGLESGRVSAIPVVPHAGLLEAARQVLPGWCAAGADCADGEAGGRMLFLPLTFQETAVGVLCLLRGSTALPFRENERQALAAVAAQLATAVFLQGPARLMIARERAERDIHFAHALKLRLLPAQAPECPGCRIAVRALPALDGGGDFHDFIALPGGRLGVLAGESSGRGVKAALQLAHVIPQLRGILASGAAPAEAVRQLNRSLVERCQRGQMVSLCFAVLDPGAARVQLAGAGSTGLHLLTRDGVRPLSVGTGTPLGVLADCDVQAVEQTLPAGAKLIFTTDGLNKCHNEHGAAFSGEQLRRLLAEMGTKANAGIPLADAVVKHGSLP